MVDSTAVLYGQTILYSIYAVIILLVMGWFGYRVTTKGKGSVVKPVYFYSFVVFLTVIGVSLHIVTYNTIPWVASDLNRYDMETDKVFNISMEDHTFKLPEEKLYIKTNDKVMFSVISNDLTYGFGLFREDNSMLFQMQVVPGHPNDIFWHFVNPGVYTIRSTEYSGPAGAQMILKDVVIVRD